MTENRLASKIKGQNTRTHIPNPNASFLDSADSHLDDLSIDSSPVPSVTSTVSTTNQLLSSSSTLLPTFAIQRSRPSQPKSSTGKLKSSKQRLTSTLANASKSKPRPKTLLPKVNDTTQVLMINGQPLNAPYLRVFPTVQPNSTENKKNTSYLSNVNLTAPLNRGEEDDEFDKRRNNDQLVKVWPTTTASLVSADKESKSIEPSLASSTPNSIDSNSKTKKFLKRKPVIEGKESNSTTVDRVPSKSASLSQKTRKKNKSAVPNAKLATGRAAVDVGSACTESNQPVNCFYGIFRCVMGKCTITSFDCGSAGNKGRRVFVSQADFTQFL